MPQTSKAAKVALVFAGLGLVTDVAGVAELVVNNHPGGMAGMAYAGLFIIALAMGAIFSGIGVIASAFGSMGRWKGPGERAALIVSLVCLLGMPPLGFLVISQAP